MKLKIFIFLLHGMGLTAGDQAARPILKVNAARVAIEIEIEKGLDTTT